MRQKMELINETVPFDDKSLVFNSSIELRDTTRTSMILLSSPAREMVYLLYGLTGTISLIGNALVILVAVFGKRTARGIQFFIINLAISDILLALFSIPATTTNFIEGQWIFYSWLCSTAFLTQTATVHVSVYTLCAIALDRYLAITRPLRPLTQRQRQSIQAAIWALGLAFGLAQYVKSGYSRFRLPSGELFLDCQERWTQRGGMILTLITMISTLLLPFLIIGTAYGLMCLQLQAHKAPPGEFNEAAAKASKRQRKSIFKLLLVNVVAFIATWLPAHVWTLLLYLAPETINTWFGDGEHICSYIAVNIAIHWLSMLSTLLNPIFCSFASTNFWADLPGVPKSMAKSLRRLSILAAQSSLLQAEPLGSTSKRITNMVSLLFERLSFAGASIKRPKKSQSLNGFPQKRQPSLQSPRLFYHKKAPIELANQVEVPAVKGERSVFREKTLVAVNTNSGEKITVIVEIHTTGQWSD